MMTATKKTRLANMEERLKRTELKVRGLEDASGYQRKDLNKQEEQIMKVENNLKRSNQISRGFNFVLCLMILALGYFANVWAMDVDESVWPPKQMASEKHKPDPQKSINQFFSCAVNYKDYENVAEIPKAILCLIVRHMANPSQIRITSGYRKSFHHNGLAVDFHFLNYPSDWEGKVEAYIDGLYEIIVFL